MAGNKKGPVYIRDEIRQEAERREPVRRDWAVARGRMWPISIPPLSFVKRKELSKALSASPCVAPVCAVFGEESCCYTEGRTKSNYHTPSRCNFRLRGRQRS